MQAENDLEQKIMSDPDWLAGAEWGLAREGHPEASNMVHIDAVLKNIDEMNVDSEERKKLRIIALLHDTFKNRVDVRKPKVGDNNHGVIAAKFAEKYITDQVVLKIIKLHDEAYAAWRSGHLGGDWNKAEVRLENLFKAIGRENIILYYHFYKCDNETGDKDQECLRWFESFIGK